MRRIQSIKELGVLQNPITYSVGQEVPISVPKNNAIGQIKTGKVTKIEEKFAELYVYSTAFLVFKADISYFGITYISVYDDNKNTN